jgi:putative Mg2+ transporter-C (MgtC) family protein
MDLGWVDLDQLGSQLGKLLLSFGLCFPMAWDREQRDRSLGLRTFPLVAMASCAFVLVADSQGGLGGEPQAMSRVLQGIIAGVGFLGGGAIVKQGMNVRGAATAAAVWTTSALGVSVAAGEFGIAVALGLIGFATLRWLKPLKRVASGADGDEVEGVDGNDPSQSRQRRSRASDAFVDAGSDASRRASPPSSKRSGPTVTKEGK